MHRGSSQDSCPKLSNNYRSIIIQRKNVLTNATGKNVLPQILQGNNSPTCTLPFSKREKNLINKFFVQIVKLPNFNDLIYKLSVLVENVLFHFGISNIIKRGTRLRVISGQKGHAKYWRHDLSITKLILLEISCFLSFYTNQFVTFSEFIACLYCKLPNFKHCLPWG